MRAGRGSALEFASRPVLPGVNAEVDPRHDREWDAFISAAGGHYAQTSLWAQLKNDAGWRATRVLLGTPAGAKGGAQMLVRRVVPFGAVGYVPKGPVVPHSPDGVTEFVADALLSEARARRVQFLVVQPPSLADDVERHLMQRGFAPTSEFGTPPATLVLDLSDSLDVLLAKMNKWTRRNIRRGEARGVRLRRGEHEDLTTFIRLREQASQRKGFYTHSEKYYRLMWRIFRPGAHLHLGLAEYDNEVVSGMLMIAFGDTVYAHASGWSGRHGTHKPNEVLEWAAIKWAKELGYRYFDFEGILDHALEAADARPDMSALTDDRYVTPFKRGFGGQAVAVPPAYEYVPNPILRWSYKEAYPRLARLRLVSGLRERAMGRLRPRPLSGTGP